MWFLLTVTILWLGESTCSVSEASESNMLYFVAMPQFSVFVWRNPFFEPQGRARLWVYFQASRGLL